MSSILPKNFQNIYVTNIIPDTATSTSNLSATNITGVNLVVARATIPNIVLTGSLNANFNSNTLGTSLFTTAGNVGIGTVTPNAFLQISNALANRKIVLFEQFNNDHQYGGFGLQTDILRYQVWEANGNHVFYAGTNSTTSNELLRITGTGNLIVAGTSNSVSLSSGNIFSTNVSSANLVGINVSSTNLFASNITTSNLSVNNNIEIKYSNATASNRLTINTLDNFIHLSNTVGHYSLMWAQDSGTITGPMLYLAGYGGQKFFTNGLTRMFISNNGNIGINTIDPTFTLDVNGSIDASTFITSANLYSTNITSTNAVLTNISTSNLMVNNITSGGIRLYNNGFTSGILFGTGTSSSIWDDGQLHIATDDHMYFDIGVPLTNTDGNNAMYINTSRNVGIGTTNPSYKLDINGTARINTTRGILIGTSADIDNSRMISALNSGLPSGGTNYITVGVDASQNNQSEYGFKYDNNGSVLNCASIGVFAGVRLNVNQNTVAIGTSTNSTSKLVIYESTGTAPSGIAGSLFIQRGNTGGSSSIVFPAVSNINSDYGYIQFIDSVANAGFTSYNYFGSTGTEVAALLIGCENDAAVGVSGSDSVIISPIGNVAITPKNNTTYISGNVGINNTAPSFTLDVTGSARISTSLTTNSLYATTSITTGGLTLNGDGQLNLINVGDARLNVRDFTGNMISFYSNNTKVGNITGTESTMSIQLNSINNTNQIFLASTGNVGIGTTNPAFTLDVTGTARFTNSITSGGIRLSTGFTSGISFGAGTSSSIWDDGQLHIATDDHMYFDVIGALANTAGSNAMYINISRHVGIGTTNPSGPLQIGTTALFSGNGNLTCTGDVIAYGSISDQRLKTNIQTISPETAINTVKQLNPVTFKWKEDVFNKQRQNKFDSGFIAQEVESVLEHATGEYIHIESGTIYKNLKHERIIPYLLRTVQSLLERVELLERLSRTYDEQS